MSTKKGLPISSDNNTQGTSATSLASLLQHFPLMARRWLTTNTFVPPWLPANRYTQLTGYLATGVLQVLMAILVISYYSTPSFLEAPALLVVLLVSFGWGATTGITATLIGVVLIVFAVPATITSGPHVAENIVGLLLYTLLGLTVGLMASQTRRTHIQASMERKDAKTARYYLYDLLKQSPIPITVVQGPEHRLEFVSPHTQLIAGKRQLVGLPIHDAFPEYASQGIFELLDQVYTTGEPLTVRELRAETLHHGDGPLTSVEQYFNVVYQPLRTPQGTVDGAMIFNIDVTEQVRTHKQIELLMREREQERDQLHDVLIREQQLRTMAENATRQLQTVVEVLPVGVTIADASGRILLRNSATFRAWGEPMPETDAEAIVDYSRYRGWWATTGKLVATNEWGLARALAQGEVSLSEEIDIATFDGQHKTTLNFAAPILDDQGTITGGVAALLDITQRRHLERQTSEALQALLILAEACVSLPTRSEETGEVLSPALAFEVVSQRLVALIRSVLDCQRVSITIVDPRTQELRSVAAVGLSTEQEQQWRERRPGFHLSDQVSGNSIEAQFLAGNVVVVDMHEPPFAKQPNPYGISSMLLAPMRINTRLIGILALDHGGEGRLFTDSEKTLTRAVAELAALILERERLLGERAESQANILALQQANKLKDEFIGIAGHELRTPLTTIKASIQLAKRQTTRLLALEVNHSPEATKLFSTLQTHLDRAERQVNMQNRLVNDLLDLSRIETGRLELHPTLTDLVVLVREIVEDQWILTPERLIGFEQDIPGEILVIGDADRLRQVVMNYLSNALKYSMVDQIVSVCVTVKEGQAGVEVKDSGPGLSEEQQHSIWERFYRVPGIEVKSGSGVGLGLGLHISKTIIERHNGKIGVQSTKGQGSTFWLTLPLAE